MLRFLSKRVLSFAVVLLFASIALGASHGYEALSEWSSLPAAKTGITAGLASSYDRTGGNLDFNYYESPTGHQTGDVDPVTVATITGPGVITRFWMPHAAANKGFNVKMYVDGAVTPVIDTNSNTFLDGGYGYFQSPLVGTLVGGQVSYEPIVFSQSLKIESNNFGSGGWAREHHYYQYGYHRLPTGTPVTPYTGTLTSGQQSARNTVVSMITNVGQNPAGSSGTSTVLTKGVTSITAGSSLALANPTGSGRVRRLNLKMVGASDAALDGLRLRVRYDGKAENAIDVPVSHFFGAGHDRVAYKSLPLGTDGNDGFYCYWPMPFRDGVVVELYNSTGSSIGIDSAAVEYEAEAVASDAGYLHAVYHEETTTSGQQYHQLLDVSGEGHYVGNLLFVQRAGTGGGILEGDDVIIVDGSNTLYGTGLEDAYNGGYYYNHVLEQSDDGDVVDPYSGIGPYHGLLRMNFGDLGDDYVRTDQYRWLIGDYVPFTDGIEVKIENYGSGANVLFGSTAFYYVVPEPACMVILLVGGIGLLRRRR
ncbi:MAG: DUF2961 domain-containing protein [Phycisphaerae bacterium]|nr:DUF2961 domain-containing protein [Phycisphaerae bacterium]